MSVQPRTIAKNTTFYIVALTTQKVLSFGYFTFLARSLGTAMTGHYFFALSIAAVMMVFMDLGLTSLLTREVARKTDHASTLLSHIFLLKVLLTCVIGVIAYFTIPFVIPEKLVRHLLYISFLISVMDSFALTFFGIIRAHQNLFYESIAAFFFYFVVIAFGVTAIVLKADLRVIIASLLVASVTNVMYAYVVLRKKFQVRIVANFNWEEAKRLMYLAAPFAFAAIFAKIYAYLDTIMLNFLHGADTVGIYSVAYKATFALQFIPLAFVAGLYPAYAYYWHHEREHLNVVFQKALEYLLILSVPVVVGVIAISGNAIPHLYTTSFTGSIMPLNILIASLPFLFLSFPIGSLLNACNRQTRQTINLGITMVFNTILNIMLIPRYGALGAAVASTASTVFNFLLGIYIARKLVTASLMPVVVTFLKLIVIALILYTGIVWLMRFVPWYAAVIPAVLLFIILAVAVRVIRLADFRLMKSMVRR